MLEVMLARRVTAHFALHDCRFGGQAVSKPSTFKVTWEEMYVEHPRSKEKPTGLAMQVAYLDRAFCSGSYRFVKSNIIQLTH